MRKSWILLLFMVSVLFIPYSEALAGPIDGTWRIESGSIEALSDEYYEGYIDTNSVKPREFPIVIVELEGEKYGCLVNKGNNVEFNWKLTSHPGFHFEDDLSDFPYFENLEKISEYEYCAYEEGAFAEIELLDDSTLKVTITIDVSLDEYSYIEMTFSRVSDDTGGGGGGGCNSAAGLLIMLPVLSLFAFKRKK